jgi:hypothetical protein
LLHAEQLAELALQPRRQGAHQLSHGHRGT